MSKELRLAFWEKKAAVDALEAEIKPLRDKYDKLTQDYHKAISPLIEQLREAEAPLYEMKNELADLVRGLGGKTALQPGDKQ